MPGLYINDGGETASALGRILGGIATNLGPEAAAKAQVMRLQAEEADRQNWLLSAQQRGVGDIPGALGAMNADPTAGGVPGAVAGMAQPPVSTAPGVRDPTAGFSPYAGVVAGSYAKDPSMANFATGVNLGRTATLGPGHDYATETDVAKQNMSPYDIGAGQERHFPTRLGMGGGAGGVGGATPGGGTSASGETVVAGPSAYGNAAAQAGGPADLASAKNDVGQGAQADVSLGKASVIREIFEKYIEPANTTGGILSEEAIQNISERLGIRLDRLNPLADAKTQIRQLFASMVAALRDNMGQPMFKGGLPEIMKQFPDPDLNPERFKLAVQTLEATLAQQKADGQAAYEYLRNGPTAQGYVEVLRKKGLNAGETRAAFERAGLGVPQEGAAPPVTEGPPPPPPATAPAPPPAAVEHLRAHPELAPAFEKKYGPGSASKVLGQ